MRSDLKRAFGSLQLCAGQFSCGKAAVHAMWRVYQSSNTSVVIFVDASDAQLQETNL